MTPEQPASPGGKRKALGRGLAALIPGAPVYSGASAAPTGGADGLRVVGIEEIHPAPNQPRRVFEETRLAELAESIRSQGVIQPLIVRRREGGGYELIAGERRWRAAQRAGLHELPVVLKDAASDRAFEMSLVENLQRADLNPIEEAESYRRLVEEHGYTQDQIASRVGKDRATVANSLRLLRLPVAVSELVIAGRLSMGHARALLGLDNVDDIEKLAKEAVARDLSVRQVEALVRRKRDEDAAPAPEPQRPSAAARDLGERLQRQLGVRTKIVEAGPGRGRLEIHYGTLDELDRVLARLLPNG